MADFPGTWMTESGSVVYRVVPKCACSSIGQILHYSDHGRYFDGDIHDAEDGIGKWSIEASQGAIVRAARDPATYTFTCVRNPYTRILSSFFDKIAGIQRNGGRYRGNLQANLKARYGVEVGSPEDGFDFDQITSFRRFLLFARDTIRFRRIEEDIHWTPVKDHVETLIHNGGHYDKIVWTERFNDGMRDVLAAIDSPVAVDIDAVPRFNESEGHGPKRLHPVEDYFDDLSRHLVWEIYRDDFTLFGYDFDDPSNKMPVAEIDYDRVHRVLAG